jgi:replicative DNA helicase
MSVGKKVQFFDAGNERALIGTILKNGKDAFIDADNILAANDLYIPINKALYASIESLAEDTNCEKFDLESIKLKMRALGFGDYLNSNKDLEYIELLNESNFNTENIPMFAYQIKKYSCVRDLYSRYSDATKYLESISGNESLSDIIRNSESKIVDFIAGTEDAGSLEKLTEDLENYIKQVLEQEIVDQVGLPTGFPIWDEAIGGGLRRGTVAVKAARPKVGKSFDALNVAINVASKKIPVLYLDTELTEPYQKSRMVCIRSGCPIYLYETRKFKSNKDLVSKVTDAGKELTDFPLYYKSIAGMSHTEALVVARRWLVKHVGFNDQGKANDCLIIYDYFKLTSGSSLTKVTPEYIVLGLMLTEMHNFCVKYDLPILGYVQVNREGIDSEDTDIVAGSDRILWLCSSLSLLKNKDEVDVEMKNDWSYGNKKLVVIETRQGSGIEKPGDYINLHASLRPNVNKFDACGLIREGCLFSEISSYTTQSNVRSN